MTSVLNVDTIAAKDGTSAATLTKQSPSKAWAYFNGGGTAALRTSFNHSALTDTGTGRYTMNLINNMSAASGYVVSSVRSAYHLRPPSEVPATGSYKLESDYVSGTSGQMTANDSSHAHTTVDGDLA